jgi:uncharacterized protein YndB with AHSA1/START domain
MTDLGLHVERSIAAAPEAVFDAFVGIHGDAHPDWIVDARVDLRVGGEWHVTFEPPGVGRFEERRTIARLERPHALAYDLRVVPADGGREFTAHVAIAFERAGDATLVRLEERGFPDAETRDDFAGAWPDVLALLEQRAG